MIIFVAFGFLWNFAYNFYIVDILSVGFYAASTSFSVEDKDFA